MTARNIRIQTAGDASERRGFFKLKHMTPTEALKEIIKEKKWYVVWTKDKDGKLVRDSKKESVLRVQALRILNGTAQYSAIKNFFEYFGSEVEINVIDNEQV